MALFYWNEQLMLGVKSIDRQHKVIVDIINDLHDSILRGGEKKDFIEVMNRLVEYAEKHFSFEEKMFKESPYDKVQQHEEEHNKFFKEVRSYQEKLENDELEGPIIIVNFLKNWLIHHILNIDAAYVPFLDPEDLEKDDFEE